MARNAVGNRAWRCARLPRMPAAPRAVAVEGGRCAWRLAPHGRRLLQRRTEGAETKLPGVPWLGSQQWAIPGRLSGHERDLHPDRQRAMWGESVYVRGDLRGRRITKKKKKH